MPKNPGAPSFFLHDYKVVVVVPVAV